MRRMIGKILRTYGIPATVIHQKGSAQVKIFFQPSKSKSWESMNPIVGPLGQLPGGQYLYIGPAEQEISEGDQVEVAGSGYVFRRCEAYRDSDGPVYWWGLCVRRGGEDKWGSLL
jgi:hypothetical protein